MTDRKKVIKRLEDCSSREVWKCSTCKWYDENSGECFTKLAADALALLKEQEAVEPVKEHEAVMNNTLVCGVCHTLVALWCVDRHGNITKFLFKAKYCPECGRRVKWYD